MQQQNTGSSGHKRTTSIWTGNTGQRNKADDDQIVEPKGAFMHLWL